MLEPINSFKMTHYDLVSLLGDPRGLIVGNAQPKMRCLRCYVCCSTVFRFPMLAITDENKYKNVHNRTRRINTLYMFMFITFDVTKVIIIIIGPTSYYYTIVTQFQIHLFTNAYDIMNFIIILTSNYILPNYISTLGINNSFMPLL